jgi:lysine-N-methylase
MSDTNAQMLVPQYVRRFKCIGGACEDSCCQGWQVPIDRTTYDRYRSCADPELLVSMTSNVTKNRANPTPANYAKIKMSAELACPFLDTERLCSIQKKLGEEALSVTCATYPRISSMVNGVLEQAMTMSCPEAARLALLDPDVMEFDEVALHARLNDVTLTAIDSRTQPEGRVSRYFWELRIFTISLLQNRAYPLGERLVMLGMFFRALDELVAQGNAAGTPELIASYTVNVERGVYREHLALLPAKNPVQIFLIEQVLDTTLLNVSASRRYIECLTEFSLGIGNTTGAKAEEVVRRYSEVCEQYYEPFMQRHEYMLEHYLVNLVFKGLFPFNGDGGLFENYVKVVVQYALLRTYLIGLSGYHKEQFDTGHVLKLLQSFSKTIEHNGAYLKALHKQLLANDGATMAFMALLINGGSSGKTAAATSSLFLVSP